MAKKNKISEISTGANQGAHKNSLESLETYGEFGVIDAINELLQHVGHRAIGTVLGIGDDAAIIRPNPAMELVMTCDAQVEGLHYLTGFSNPYQRGRRAMAANTSDIGAMGGQPRYALVSLGVQQNTTLADIKEIYRGFCAELAPYDAEIIGGNLSRVENAGFIDITLIGEVEQGKAVRRSGGQPGDAVLMTGFPGQAAAGLRRLREGGAAEDVIVQAYLRPASRAREGYHMGRSGLLRAMIDISDGLVADLGHICRASGTGACLYIEQLPLNPALQKAAVEWGVPALKLQCAPSDDYELLLCCRPQDIVKLRQICLAVDGTPLHKVGYLTEVEEGVYLEDNQGQRHEVGGGWDHFAPTS
jgi:thiamine-monophosphate kinase